MFTFAKNSFRWEQRAAGEDSVLQVRTGTYSIDGMTIYFVPDSYTEDGVAKTSYAKPFSETIMEISNSKFVVSPWGDYIKQ